MAAYIILSHHPHDDLTHTTLSQIMAASNDITEFSGGAIFHTGYLRVSKTLFLANEAGADGPAVMSIGNLDGLSNVSFFENSYHCRAGDYSYMVKNEARKHRASVSVSIEIRHVYIRYQTVSLM